MQKRILRGVSSEDALAMFNRPGDETTEYRKGVVGVRTVRIQHGPMLDIMCFPIYARASGPAQAVERIRRETSKAQKELNRRNSQLRLQRWANHNFDEGDVMLTATFSPSGPDTERSARRAVKNFIAKLRRHWKRLGRDLKYIYTMEMTEPKHIGRQYHLHILLNAHGFDRDWVEGLWQHGLCNSRRYQQTDEFFSGLAGYFNLPKDAKEGQEKAGRRYWEKSRNLKPPKETRADHKFTVRKIEKIALSLEMDGRAILESAYPGYRCTRDVRCTRSDFLPGVYMFARMRRQEEKKRSESGPKRSRRTENAAKGARKSE